MAYDILTLFDDIQEHASYCRSITFRVDDLGDDSFRVRIQAGRFAYDDKMSKEKLQEILSWAKHVGAKEVKGSVSSEMFFS